MRKKIHQTKKFKTITKPTIIIFIDHHRPSHIQKFSHYIFIIIHHHPPSPSSSSSSAHNHTTIHLQSPNPKTRFVLFQIFSKKFIFLDFFNQIPQKLIKKLIPSTQSKTQQSLINQTQSKHTKLNEITTSNQISTE